MTIEAIVKDVTPVQTGVSAKTGKEWRKVEVTAETMGQYPKLVRMSILGDNIEKIPLQLGVAFSFSVDLESREYNGKWYTEVKCFGARPYQPQQQPQYQQYQQPPQQTYQPQAPYGQQPQFGGGFGGNQPF